MDRIIDIIYFILIFIRSKLRQSKNRKLQHETDEIEKDPASWLSKHFNSGMHSPSNTQDKATKTDDKDNNKP